MHAETFTLEGDEYMVLSFELPVDAAQGDVAQPLSKFGVLSKAESEVVTLVLEGLRNVHIAQRRGVSPQTIANQISVIYRKLGIASRRELAALAEKLRRGES